MADDQFSDYLNVYYKKLFPYPQFHKWLSYGNVKPENFLNREFSFTLHEDIYIRYQSFNTLQEFETEIQNKCPFKIDIGAVFNMSPKVCRNYPQFHALEKELVIDIDMTDYDQIRTCCSGAEVCQKCWRFMVIAVKILERALRDDFGWKHLLWVFSGRRGIHCWVCDESARKLLPSERGSFIDYLAVLSAGDSKRYNVVNHPSVKRSIAIIKEEFNSLLSEQDFLGTTEQCNKILSFIADEKLKEQINVQFSKYQSSAQRWEALTVIVNNNHKRGLLNFKTKYCVEDILLYLAYPRLDVNVTKGLNHLLKSPFCVHPKTGKICIPINPKVIEKFNPNTVPTINVLIDEINEYDKKQKEIINDANLNSNRLKDYKKTSLLKSVNIFEEFLRNLESTWKGSRIKQSDIKMEF